MIWSSNIHMVLLCAMEPICLIPASAARTAWPDLLIPSDISWLSYTIDTSI